MANRRMFSKRIISSARFMKLTKDAQVLYFHLCLNADDDGAVEGFPVRRSIGIEEDAYANLEGRGFITVLDRENEVFYINDWNEHNRIRADRIQTSVYRDLIQNVIGDVALIEPKQRSDIKGNRNIIDVSAGSELDGRTLDGPRTDNGQPVDNQRTGHGRSTDGPRTGHGRAMDGLGEDRLGQDRSSEDKKGKEKRKEKTNCADAPSRPRFMRPTIQEIEAYCQEKGCKHVDAEYFWNYYENINWHVGKNKMKSWKLAVANWEKRQSEFVAGKQQVASSRQEIVTYDDQPTWGGIFDGIYDE